MLEICLMIKYLEELGRTVNLTDMANQHNIVVLIEYDITGHTIILLPKQYGHNFWLHIVKMIDEHGTKGTQHPGHMKLLCSRNYDQYEEMMSCDNINNNILHQEDKYIEWKLKHITEHEEPINVSHTNNKGT